MEKRILIAALLSALVMMVYSRSMGPQLQQRALPPMESSSAEQIERSGQPQAPLKVEISQLSETKEVTYIFNRGIQLEVDKNSATIRSAVLKAHRDLETGEPLSFGGVIPVASFEIDGQPLTAKITSLSDKGVSWMASDSNGNNYHISAELDEDKPLLYIEIESESSSVSTGFPQSITLLSGWNKGDDLSGRHNRLEAILNTTKDQPFQWKYVKYYGTQKKVRSVSRGTSFITLADRFFCQSVKLIPDSPLVSAIPSPDGTIAIRSKLPLLVHDGQRRSNVELFLGTRKHHELKRTGFVEAIPIGFLGRIGLVLLFTMNVIASVVGNYGLAIIIFSIGIACALAPFTLMGMRSMKKMQQLKPEMDRIMAKQKVNPQKANMEMMALYKEHKVSPMSGCLPMLLQFPVLIAFFQAISHFVELRGEGFLWITDLSLPDRLFKLPFELPLIGGYFNLLPLIMTGAMIVQMRFSRKQMPSSADNPMSRIMSGPMMSVIFGFMFYQFPAGLVLYWLTNSIMTLVWYRIAAKD